MTKLRYTEVYIDKDVYELEEQVNTFVESLHDTYSDGFEIEVNKITYTPVPHLDMMMVNVEYTLIDKDYL